MYVGVDIGGTKTRLARFAEDGIIEQSSEFATPQDYATAKDQMIKAVTALMTDRPLKGIGVGAPGVMNYEDDSLRSFGNLPWTNVNIKADLEAHFKVPVSCDNDAKIGALGEAVNGAGKGKKCVLYVTIGTGIGTGVVYDGQLVPALAKSEGGQMYLPYQNQLKRWEEFASGKAFLERTGHLGSEVEDQAVWQEYSALLAPGLVNLASVIQPDIIVIGGGMGANLSKFQTALTTAMAGYPSPVVNLPPIVMAKDPNNAVLLGCFVEASRHASAQ